MLRVERLGEVARVRPGEAARGDYRDTERGRCPVVDLGVSHGCHRDQPDGDVDGRACYPGQDRGARRRQCVADPNIVDRQPAERTHAANGRDRRGTSERPTACVGADRKGDVAGVGSDQVISRIFDAHCRRRTDRLAGYRVRRLRSEAQVVCRTRDDRKARRSRGQTGARCRDRDVADQDSGD